VSIRLRAIRTLRNGYILSLHPFLRGITSLSINTRSVSGGQPIYILTDDTSRTHGRAARDSNVMAGRAVATAVRTTLGPRGMDKMLVSDSGDVVITNDGATILQEMDIEHPAAQMIVEVAESQEDEVGDGTTTAAVLAGQLLVEAQDVLEQDVHPSTIVEGYDLAAHYAHDAIREMELDVDVDDDLLRTVAASSMTGKGIGALTPERLAELVVDAVRQAYPDADRFDRDDVRVLGRTGGSSPETELVQGIVLDESPLVDDMPRTIEDASVLVYDAPLTVRTTELDAEYQVTSVDQLTAAMAAEEGQLRPYATTLKELGVDVVVCTKTVDDRVDSFLAREGILAFKSVGNADARAVARATGAKRLGTLEDLDTADLGLAETVRVERFGEDELVVLEGGRDASAVTVLVRGGTEHVVEELERAVDDAIDVVATTIATGAVVPGAGAVEVAVAEALRDRAAGAEGRQQLAVEAFADAMDAIPLTIAANAGMDPVDALVDLRARHEKTGRAGIVVATDGSTTVTDPLDAGVLDPAAVKLEAVENAADAARMIFRIDDVIAAK
jgi:thermosome